MKHDDRRCFADGPTTGVAMPRPAVVAAGGVECVWESFGEAGPSLDHGDAETFGERSIAVDQ